MFSYKMEKIFKKFNATELQRNTFTQYIDYMNDESKKSFLQKVLRSDKDYFLQFVDVDLERFEEEMFKGMKDVREKHSHLYDAKTNPESKLFLYKCLLIRLKDKPKEERKMVYEKYFGIDYKDFEKKSVEEKREEIYNGFSKFINSHKDLKGFINSIFDEGEIIWCDQKDLFLDTILRIIAKRLVGKDLYNKDEDEILEIIVGEKPLVKKWKKCLELAEKCKEGEYVDLISCNIVKKTKKIKDAYYFKSCFCAPLVHKSLVRWAVNNSDFEFEEIFSDS